MSFLFLFARSSSGANPEEEEEMDSEGEESDQEGRDYSWKKTIMIGPSFQASVPAGKYSLVYLEN